MKQLFPIEIQENTIQNHFVKRHTTSKTIYWIILSALIIVSISLPFIVVDVTSQSRSNIRGLSENNNLQSVLYGEVIKTNIHENQFVKAGDTLIWLRLDELEEQLSRLHERVDENDEFIEDLSKLIAGNYYISTPKYKTQLAEYRGRLAEKNVSLSQSKKEYEVSKILFNKGIEAKFDHEQVESRYEVEKSQTNLLYHQQRNAWEAERTNLEQENKNLYSEIHQAEKRKTQYFIIAPISGNIVQYTGLSVGNFIVPSHTIAQITSADNLLVECYVSPNDIGYIDVNQKIKLQVDAFNYQQWGLLDGEVTEVISDVVQIENQPYFRVRCSLDKHYLELPNGYRGNLKKGMSATARFFLTRRSLAQLLFDKIDNWVNPKIVYNGNQD